MNGQATTTGDDCQTAAEATRKRKAAAAIVSGTSDNQKSNAEKVENKNSAPSPSPCSFHKKDNKYKKFRRKENKYKKSNKHGGAFKKGNKGFKGKMIPFSNDKQSSQKPHPGSFACETMRKLHGIELESSLLEPLLSSASSSSSSLAATAETAKSADSSNENNTTQTTEIATTTTRNTNTVKRKVAFLIGYVGTAYKGFQVNENQYTIQAVFELALYKAGLLIASNFGFPVKYSWSTSGRTDKGVHAAAQVCSAKVEVALPPATATTNNEAAVGTEEEIENKRKAAVAMEDSVREAVSAHLPADMRVLDVIRTTRSFCAHTQRDRVRYHYMFPAFVLSPVHTIRALLEKETAGRCLGGLERNEKNAQQLQQNSNPSSAVTDCLTPKEVANIRSQLSGYRASHEQLKTLQRALRAYEGTHSFHNFTKGCSPGEARASRFIARFDVEDPVEFNVGEGMQQWIPLTVTGQSFLIHQIRKMVCVAMDIARGAAPVEVIPKALAVDKKHNNTKKDGEKSGDVDNNCNNDNGEGVVRVNIAPAQGLFLDMSFYRNYNERKQKNPELRDLDWSTDPSTPACVRWKEFRNTVIRKHVVQEEYEQGNFIKHMYIQGTNKEIYQTYAHERFTHGIPFLTLDLSILPFLLA